MKCNRQKEIEPFLSGELHGQELTSISNHLEQCEDCQTYLEQLREHKEFIRKVKVFKPELANPGEFRNEILGKIKPRQEGNFLYEVSSLVDHIIALLVHPVTRYSFISAAVIIFGVFIYQQTIIVQKISSLEKRMETNIDPSETSQQRNKSIEAFFKRRSNEKIEDKEFNELLDDYRLLMLKQKVLLKALQEKYPDAYKDILKDLEEADLLLENINI